MVQRGEDSWRLIVFAGLDPTTKKRQYVRKTVRGTKRDAATALAGLVADTRKQQKAGIALMKRGLSLSDVLDTWLEGRKAVLSPATFDRYQVAIKHVKASELGRLPVMKLRPHHVEDLYAGLVAQGQSGSSIRKVHWALRQSLAWAHRRGYAVVIATDGIELPPLGERALAPPSSDDVRKLVDHTLSSDPQWGAPVAFVAWTGCRRGEVCGLRWNDLDLERKSALIARSVAAVPGGVQIKGTKTGDMRRIALGPKTVEMLKAHRARCEERANVCGTTVLPSGYVFSPAPDCARPYNPHTLTTEFIDACKAAAVPHMRLHDLRHHSATALLKHGTSLGEVMDRHGWRSVAMVNRYRHLLEAGDAQAAAAIENV
jgi:integrase